MGTERSHIGSPKRIAHGKEQPVKLKLTVLLLMLLALAGYWAESPAPADSAPIAKSHLNVISERADIFAAQAATIPDPKSYYRLQTLFSQEEEACLEGNNRTDGALLDGAAFMDYCRNVTGQLWKFVPTQQEGYYQLQTKALETQNKCLEGNRTAPDAVLGGAAFMSDCSGASGQQWKLVDQGNGLYSLHTKFLEDQNKCLEGNRLHSGALVDGAAYQNDCKGLTGQLWTLTPVAAADADKATDRALVELRYSSGAVIQDTGVYYYIQTIAGDEDKLCLEGNDIAAGTTLAGAAFRDQCKDVTGQKWNIIPTDRPDYYHLQPMSFAENFGCFEGNRLARESFLGGGAFVDNCSYVTGQNWRFVDAGNGLYYMQTEFLQDKNKCLEGNTRANDTLLQGAAYMDTCQKTAGQLWLLAPIAGTTTAP